MCEEHPVFMQNIQVGKIKLERVGLYCRYAGEIKPDTAGIYRIYVMTDKENINLGVCQPTGGSWVARGKIPCHHIYGHHIRFVVNPEETLNDLFCAIGTGESFEALEDLDRYRFAVRNGQQGLISCDG